MDSTDPLPQQQQQQRPPPPSQQHQQQQQHLQQQPQPHHHHQPHMHTPQTHPPSQAAAPYAPPHAMTSYTFTAHPHAHPGTYAHRPPYGPTSQFPPSLYQSPTQYQTYGPYQAWANQAASFQAAPIATPPTSQTSPAPKLQPREKKILVFKNPHTGKPVDLADNTKSNTVNNKATAATETTSSPSVAHEFLKNLSEEGRPVDAAPPVIANNTNSTTAAVKPPSTIPKAATPVASTTTTSTASAVATTLSAVTTTTTAITITKPSATTPTSTNNITQEQNERQGEDKVKENDVVDKAVAQVDKKIENNVNKVEKSDNDDKVDEVVKNEVTETERPNNLDGDGESVANEDAEQGKKEEEEKEEKKMGGEEENKDEDKGTEEENSKEGEESDTDTALHYEPGQYNPSTNRNGKKHYSKQFMLDVCKKICKLNIDETTTEDNATESYDFALGVKVDMFRPVFDSGNSRHTPANRSNDSSRRQNQHNYTGRSSAGQERQRKIIVSTSLTQEVELKTVSNPWRSGKEAKEEASNDEVAELESLKKKFRSILNKLTPDNFNSLAEQVTSLHIDTEDELSEVIDIVFAKALAEPGYCTLYGSMCSHLKNITANFAMTLLKRCQNQFQSDIYSSLDLDGRRKKIDEESDPEVKKHLEEELYEDMYRCRMRGLGLIKFIGELYKIQMLNDKIMFECIIRLLGDISEESLECLCDLLTTIGEKLDTSSQNSVKDEKGKKAQKPAKTNAYQGGQRSLADVVGRGAPQHKVEPEPMPITTLDPVFDQLHKIRKNKELPISLRIRFKLLDVCDLREKEGWHSKKKDNDPKKIEEIRVAHREKLENERRQNAMGPRRSQEGRRGLGHSSGSSNQISSLANEYSGSRGGSNMHASSSSHSIRDHSTGDMKSNHNDIESQKEHQRNTKAVQSLLLGQPSANKASSSDLRPTGGLRPGGGFASGGSSGLRPMSAASKAAAVASAKSASGTKAGAGNA